ncbi:MAG TPA: peptidylprolyl isomerase [Bryobacteraceae bacterium]|jgi:peptidyl-prolyl cis-trans isomerase SurA|nr:peptidylprolyl isomerase [Bryobacteraceae bacterium]
MVKSIPALVLALLLVAQGCKRATPTNVAAEVNARPILYAELEKQFKIQFSSSNPESNEDLVDNQKLDILRSMIDNEIMLQRAEKLGLMAVDSDVEAKFNELKAPYTQEEFQKQMDARKITIQDLKVQIRRDLSIAKLFNREITSRIPTITDKDISDFYAANKANFNLAEPQVHLATILVTPQPDPNVRNLRSDKAQNDEQAKRKIQMIEARLKQGEDFAMIAQSFSEDPNTAPNGGDMGFIPESALEQANVELRKMVMSLQPGQVSPIISTAEGYRILKLVSKEPAGQRDLNDPRVQQTIRETLQNRKDQLRKTAYYEVARNEARVTNYFAQRVLERAQSGK